MPLWWANHLLGRRAQYQQSCCRPRSHILSYVPCFLPRYTRYPVAWLPFMLKGSGDGENTHKFSHMQIMCTSRHPQAVNNRTDDQQLQQQAGRVEHTLNPWINKVICQYARVTVHIHVSLKRTRGDKTVQRLDINAPCQSH